LVHSRRVFTYEDTAVIVPNSDTPYSFVCLDLRAEPYVISVPAVEKKRYYSIQFVDWNTFNFGYIGSRATGSDAGDYLVVGPNWKGETPPGIKKVFRSTTEFSLAAYRTQLIDPKDMPNVEKVQAGYKVQTLSSFLKQPAPPAAPEIQWPAAPQEIFSTGFPAMLDYLLGYLPPVGAAAGEKALRERFASIGIGPEKKVKMQELSPELKAAFGDGVKAALGKINQAVDTLGTEVNGWRIGGAAGSAGASSVGSGGAALTAGGAASARRRAVATMAAAMASDSARVIGRG
jgi:hypothetical protein